MLKTTKKAKAGQTDRQTDRPTDRPTDEVTYRVALHATKNRCVLHLPIAIKYGIQSSPAPYPDGGESLKTFQKPNSRFWAYVNNVCPRMITQPLIEM